MPLFILIAFLIDRDFFIRTLLTRRKGAVLQVILKVLERPLEVQGVGDKNSIHDAVEVYHFKLCRDRSDSSQDDPAA